MEGGWASAVLHLSLSLVLSWRQQTLLGTWGRNLKETQTFSGTAVSRWLFSAVYLTAIWCDSCHQRVWFAQCFSFKLASLSLPKTVHVVVVVGRLVIDCSPPFQFLCLSLETQRRLTANHCLSLVICQPHHLVSTWITNYEGEPKPVFQQWNSTRLIFPACRSESLWTYWGLLCTVSQQLCGLQHWKAM